MAPPLPLSLQPRALALWSVGALLLLWVLVGPSRQQAQLRLVVQTSSHAQEWWRSTRDWSLPQHVLERGVVSRGDGLASRRLAEKLRRGEAITAGAPVGGCGAGNRAHPRTLGATPRLPHPSTPRHPPFTLPTAPPQSRWAAA